MHPAYLGRNRDLGIAIALVRVAVDTVVVRQLEDAALVFLLVRCTAEQVTAGLAGSVQLMPSNEA